MAFQIPFDLYRSRSSVHVFSGLGGVMLEVKSSEAGKQWKLTGDEARCIAAALVHYANTVD